MIAQFNGFEINKIHNGDAWKICNFVISNEDRLNHYFPKTLEQNLTPTLSNNFVEQKTKQFQNNEELLFTLKHSDTRALVGLFFLKELNWEIKQGEFAYCIGYNFEGQGLASKAIQHLSQYAFDLGLETLQIIVHKDNMASVRVATNNQFEWIKTLPNEFTPNREQPLDMELYELNSKK
ncbi:GNAT family N-acetyltransferase [Winogradskyella bathintestinalis]|uniref:GNAT family N-acetyltransferase n=1 Tax=Winogradskyella bathintestinalis TaxID=3035208 RepID=A0ABT7ZRM9_9FLAO|nr:GNAT family N-acetyltransferase [Winogradskyella bathintestinalis]MDN3491665.1 GNAT family N-acetyltransferase [Winogradskyella bathintestinalis]